MGSFFFLKVKEVISNSGVCCGGLGIPLVLSRGKILTLFTPLFFSLLEMPLNPGVVAIATPAVPQMTGELPSPTDLLQSAAAGEVLAATVVMPARRLPAVT